MKTIALSLKGCEVTIAGIRRGDEPEATAKFLLREPVKDLVTRVLEIDCPDGTMELVLTFKTEEVAARVEEHLGRCFAAIYGKPYRVPR